MQIQWSPDYRLFYADSSGRKYVVEQAWRTQVDNQVVLSTWLWTVFEETGKTPERYETMKKDCLACEFLPINLPTCIAERWETHIDKERESRMRDTNESWWHRPTSTRARRGGSRVEERFICEAMRRLIHQSLDSVQVIKWILWRRSIQRDLSFSLSRFPTVAVPLPSDVRRCPISVRTFRRERVAAYPRRSFEQSRILRKESNRFVPRVVRNIYNLILDTDRWNFTCHTFFAVVRYKNVILVIVRSVNKN